MSRSLVWPAPTLAVTVRPVPTSVGARVLVVAYLYATITHSLVAVAVAGRGGPWQLCAGLSAVTAAGNLVLSSVIRHRLGFAAAEQVRAAWNLVTHAAIGWLAGWHPTTWMFLPFITSLASAPGVPGAPLRLLGLVVGYDGAALATGADPVHGALVTLIAVYVHFLLTGYLHMAHRVLVERQRIDDELAAARQSNLARDRLAGIGQLAAGIAHEINNPMCFVTAHVDELAAVLRACPALPAELVPFRDELVPEALAGIGRVNAIVADVRHFARSGPEERELFDLHEALTAAVRMARTQLGDGQVLRASLARGLLVQGDPRQLGRAVLNLVANAIQALAERPGVVEVEAHGEAAELVVTVTDGGVGMTADVVQRLFDPFFTTREPGQGTGLGLAVTHGVIAGHGGRIEVSSVPGQGTRVSVTLPRAPAPVSGAGRPISGAG